jgi:predicted nucleic acid-binding protein
VSFLLDTNVVSEWVKPRPDPGVIRWLADIDEDRVFLSVVTLAELRHGIERLADGSRGRRLDAWLRDELPLRFEGRLLPVDEAIADRWGEVVARREAAGRPIDVIDAFIAATANVHALKLVTRDESDFKSAVNEIVNPWAG